MTTGDKPSSFEDLLEMRADRVAGAACSWLLPGMNPLSGEISRPKRLFAAMRHGVLNGGKRLRPFLLISNQPLCSQPEPNAARADRRAHRGDCAGMRALLFACP
jgi:farnesyl diphosphate synthase